MTTEENNRANIKALNNHLKLRDYLSNELCWANQTILESLRVQVGYAHDGDEMPNKMAATLMNDCALVFTEAQYNDLLEVMIMWRLKTPEVIQAWDRILDEEYVKLAPLTAGGIAHRPEMMVCIDSDSECNYYLIPVMVKSVRDDIDELVNNINNIGSQGVPAERLKNLVFKA